MPVKHLVTSEPIVPKLGDDKELFSIQQAVNAWFSR